MYHRYFDELVVDSKVADAAIVPGAEAFFLYDTLGFPIDLTELMAEEKGLAVDTDGFAAAMDAQKERSRVAAQARKAGGARPLVLQAEQTAWLADQGVAPTDDAAKYAHVETDAAADADAAAGGATETVATVRALFTLDNGFVERWEGGGAAGGGDDDVQLVGIILDMTPFYSEASTDAVALIIKISADPDAPRHGG